ncbi:hypothetical protein AZOA_07320 [Azoarcus sp. Aa7]|nr:hypothetical protein [Azoarcus sp. Aa7]
MTSHSKTRRLPPYARTLADLRQKRMRPASMTCIVRLDAWAAPEHVTIADDGAEVTVAGRPRSVCWPQVVVPEGAQPSEFDYRFLEGLDVVVAHWRSNTRPSRLRSLLREVLRADPRVLAVLDMELEQRWWFVKSLTRGVEVQL